MDLEAYEEQSNNEEDSDFDEGDKTQVDGGNDQTDLKEKVKSDDEKQQSVTTHSEDNEQHESSSV